MSAELYVHSCLLEALPVKLTNPNLQALGKGDLLNVLEYENAPMAKAIASYQSSRDLPKLYGDMARILPCINSTPAPHSQHDIMEIYKLISSRFAATHSDELFGEHYTKPTFGIISEFLNPLRGRQTYVLKSHVHCRLYEYLLSIYTISSVLEIGIFYGGSLHAWKLRLPDVRLVGLDLHPPLQDSGLLERLGARFIQGSAIDKTTLETAVYSGKYDLIIDDASHIPSHQILTFYVLTSLKAWKHAYVIEDVDNQDKTNFSNPFLQFVSLLGRLQENQDYSVRFFEDLCLLLCSETRSSISNTNLHDFVNEIQSCHVTRYGSNYVFTRF